MTIFRIIKVLIIFLSGTQVLFSGDTNFRNVIPGERAFGMGGAYISLSTDSSGCFYNPSGIVHADRSSFSVSASVYSLNSIVTEGAFVHLDRDDVDASSTELLTIPTTVATTKKINNWLTAGFCAIVTDFRKVGIDSQISILDDDVRSTHSLSRLLNDQVFYAGPTVGIKLTDKLSLGMSMFYIKRDYALSNTMSFNVPSTQSLSLSTATLKLSHNALSVLTGVRYTALEDDTHFLTLGLTYRMPSIKIASNATTSWGSVDENFVFFNQDKTCDDEFKDDSGNCTSYEDVNLNSSQLPDPEVNTEYPMEIGVGASYYHDDKWGVSVDVIQHFGKDYTLVKYQIGDFNLPLGDIFQKKYLVNASLGAEYFMSESISFRIGGYTNFSSNSSSFDSTKLGAVDSNGDSIVRPNQDKLNLYGFNFSVGFDSSNSSSHIGIGYSFGSGKTTRSFGESDTTIRDFNESQISLLIAGSYYFD